MKHDLTREQLGSDRGVVREQIQGVKIGEQIWKRAALSEQSLVIYDK